MKKSIVSNIFASIVLSFQNTRAFVPKAGDLLAHASPLPQLRGKYADVTIVIGEHTFILRGETCGLIGEHPRLGETFFSHYLACHTDNIIPFFREAVPFLKKNDVKDGPQDMKSHLWHLEGLKSHGKNGIYFTSVVREGKTIITIAEYYQQKEIDLFGRTFLAPAVLGKLIDAIIPYVHPHEVILRSLKETDPWFTKKIHGGRVTVFIQED